MASVLCADSLQNFALMKFIINRVFLNHSNFIERIWWSKFNVIFSIEKYRIITRHCLFPQMFLEHEIFFIEIHVESTERCLFKINAQNEHVINFRNIILIHTMTMIIWNLKSWKNTMFLSDLPLEKFKSD